MAKNFNSERDFILMTGSITLSIEIELGWGMHDMADYEPFSDDRSAEDAALQRLLTICDKFDLQISFDVVGHLFLDSCSGCHSGPYKEGWWDEDPGSCQKSSPLFYAPSMIKSIINSSSKHEICTHTFSHILVDNFPAEVLDYELARVRDIHSEENLPEPTSIVLPRHQTPDYSVLKDHGIETLRTPIPSYTPDFSNPVSKLKWLYSRSHPKCEITVTEGIIETTCTPHPSLTSLLLPQGQQGPAHPVYQTSPLRLRQWMHKRYLRNAANLACDGHHVHLWTHLHNMANLTQWSPIKEGLKYIAKVRDRTGVEVLRMCDLTPSLNH